VAGLAGWIFGLLAALCGAAILVAGLLWRVGRGLAATAGRARVLPAGLAALFALNGVLALAFLRGAPRLLDLVLLATLADVLWVLGWRFADVARTASVGRA
jgi:hypothetical protein